MLVDQINSDYIKAMKGRDTLKASTLSFLRAQIKNVAIEKRTEVLEDADTIAVIKKQVKQRQDSIQQFEKGGRVELAEKEKSELAILKSYLPEELSQEQLKKIVDEVIQEVGAQGMKDMGSVMKGVLSKAAGSADGEMVSTLVKESLSKL